MLVAQLRLYIAYACHKRVGTSDESLFRARLPLDLIELIGQQVTVHVALHGLMRRLALLSEGVAPGT